MYQGDLEGFIGNLIRVNRVDGSEYVGPLTSVTIHDDTSLPAADRLHFYQPNTGRTVTIYRGDIANITIICKE